MFVANVMNWTTRSSEIIKIAGASSAKDAERLANKYVSWRSVKYDVELISVVPA